uniref:Uncharacterized protein n=1 Tax=Arundo donax TaxID=35708 RepID=A0A0A8ZG44_ARUDO
MQYRCINKHLTTHSDKNCYLFVPFIWYFLNVVLPHLSRKM